MNGSWIMGLVGDRDGDGDGWVWLERAGFFWVWSGGWRSVVEVVVFVAEGWVFLGFSGFGQGGWRSVVEVVVFVGEGWVFLGLIGVEIGDRFCTV